jgi:hypothetical protein
MGVQKGACDMKTRIHPVLLKMLYLVLGPLLTLCVLNGTHCICGLHCPTCCLCSSSSSKLRRALVSGIAMKHRLSVVSRVLECNRRRVVLVDGEPASNLHCWPAWRTVMLVCSQFSV